jgi:RNA polymerase sigma-70 factor (ECF subfamily)
LGKDQIQQLILEAKQGNQLAFNQLLNEYWDQIYHFHLSRNVDPFDAEDLCIQTFAKAFDKLGSLRLQFSIQYLAHHHLKKLTH